MNIENIVWNRYLPFDFSVRLLLQKQLSDFGNNRHNWSLIICNCSLEIILERIYLSGKLGLSIDPYE